MQHGIYASARGEMELASWASLRRGCGDLLAQHVDMGAGETPRRRSKSNFADVYTAVYNIAMGSTPVSSARNKLLLYTFYRDVMIKYLRRGGLPTLLRASVAADSPMFFAEFHHMLQKHIIFMASLEGRFAPVDPKTHFAGCMEGRPCLHEVGVEAFCRYAIRPFKKQLLSAFIASRHNDLTAEARAAQRLCICHFAGFRWWLLLERLVVARRRSVARLVSWVLMKSARQQRAYAAGELASVDLRQVVMEFLI